MGTRLREGYCTKKLSRIAAKVEPKHEQFIGSSKWSSPSSPPPLPLHTYEGIADRLLPGKSYELT